MCVCHVQEIANVYRQHSYLPNTMIYSRSEFYANASLSCQVLCCKHYMSMYLEEYLTKHWLSAKTSLVSKIPHPLNPKHLELRCNSFHIFYLFRCTECHIITKAQNYSCHIYVILTTGSKKLGRLNRRLSEVLANTISPRIINIYLYMKV